MNMKMTPSRKTVDIDALLQDSYLLVVELRQGQKPQKGALRTRCEEQVQDVRLQLEEAGVDQRSIERIGYAQCALLDETVLGCARDEAYSEWAGRPLQAQFFSRHQAGEQLYGDIHEALREPAADRLVLTVYQRMLMLGFQGRYRDAQDPERERLLELLNEQVAPLEPTAGATLVNAGSTGVWQGLRSPWGQLILAALLLTGLWLGLDHLLTEAVATLLPVQD